MYKFKFKLQHLGDDASLISTIATGKHAFSKRLENAKRPVIIVGVDQLTRPDGEAILTTLYEYGAKLSKQVSTGFSLCDKVKLTQNFIFYRDGKHSMSSNVQLLKLVH